MSHKSNDTYNEQQEEIKQEQKYLEGKHISLSKANFIELTGENPEDVLGSDWENLIDDYLDEKGRDDFGETYG